VEDDPERPTIADAPPTFDVDERSDTLIGTEVGGYVIESELGRGARASHTRSRRLVGGRRARPGSGSGSCSSWFRRSHGSSS
jgi:hypothetical protein